MSETAAAMVWLGLGAYLAGMVWLGIGLDLVRQICFGHGLSVAELTGPEPQRESYCSRPNLRKPAP